MEQGEIKSQSIQMPAMPCPAQILGGLGLDWSLRLEVLWGIQPELQ